MKNKHFESAENTPLAQLQTSQVPLGGATDFVDGEKHGNGAQSTHDAQRDHVLEARVGGPLGDIPGGLSKGGTLARRYSFFITVIYTSLSYVP